jgi:hypothetical protein
MRYRALLVFMSSLAVLTVGQGANAYDTTTTAPYDDTFVEARACNDLLDLGIGPAASNADARKTDGYVFSHAKADEMLPVGAMIYDPIICGVGASQSRSQGGMVQRYALSSIQTGDHVIHVEANVHIDQATSYAQFRGLPVLGLTGTYSRTAAVLIAQFLPATDRPATVGEEFEYVTRWNEPNPTHVNFDPPTLRVSLHTTFSAGTLVVYVGLASEAVSVGAGTAETQATGKVLDIHVTALDA